MMGIDIGGAFAIAGVSGTQALKIAGASDALKIDTTGRTFYPNQIGFIAGLNTDPGWIAQPAATWQAQKFQNNTVYNKGGGYSAGRFTAPVAGAYLFHFTIYCYKPSAAQGHFHYIGFWVNGGALGSLYRLKGFFTPTGHSYFSEVVDLYYLNAGDYVELYTHAVAAGISFYNAHSVFSGYLVG